MERRHIPETETRLTILYALDRLGPVTSMQLLQFLVEEDLMNYFAMQLNLSDLQDQGQVTTQRHPLGDLIILTEPGRYALTAFEGRIPVSRRQTMDQHAPAWQQQFRLEQLAPAESFTLQDGAQCLRLRLMEGPSAIMDILITLPRTIELTFLAKRWRSAAQAVYDAVTMTLSQGFDPAAALPPLPESAAMAQSGPSEWTLSLIDDAASPSLTLLLPLADEALARHWAFRWSDACASLGQTILEKLSAGL